MIRLNLTNGEPIALKLAASGKFRGMRLPGSSLFASDRAGYNITVHVFEHPLYFITLRNIQLEESRQLILTEDNSWLRIEVLLEGMANIHLKDAEELRLLPGQYQLTDKTVVGLDIVSKKSLLYLTVHFSKELLNGLGNDKPITPTNPVQSPLGLIEIVHDILRSPFQGGTQDFYLANRIRDLLFEHDTREPVLLPGELSPEQVALMHEADRIMAHNLDGKITIPQLARMLGTNFVTLKRNYEKVFGVGIFPRMMERKMTHIKLLLSKTNRPLKDIADESGYKTLPGFLNAFRKRFKVTPGEWRNEQKGKAQSG